MNIDVVKGICAILDEMITDKPAGVNRFDELITFVKDRPGHDWRYALSADRLKSEIKWQSQVSIEEGLQETIRWYQENQEWVDKRLTEDT